MVAQYTADLHRPVAYITSTRAHASGQRPEPAQRPVDRPRDAAPLPAIKVVVRSRCRSASDICPLCPGDLPWCRLVKTSFKTNFKTNIKTNISDECLTQLVREIVGDSLDIAETTIEW